jgi:hypothetical protein
MSYIGVEPVSNYAGIVSSQQLSGNGVLVQFTLTDTPISVSNCDVYVGGLYQNKDTFTVVGNLLTFSEAPPTGTNNIEVRVSETIPIGATTAGLVSFTPSGSLVSTDVQSAITEVVSDLDILSGLSISSGVPNNINGTNGDIYFNKTGGALTTIYQKRVGVWVGIV